MLAATPLGDKRRMRPRSPLDFDVSVSADKARRARRRGMTGETAAADRPCDHKGCDRPGLYRAPRAPQDLSRFRWFCLDHIRAYNAAWDYFRDLAPEAVDAYVDAARVWERPTWRLGDGPKAPTGATPHADGRAWERFGFRDPLDVLGARATRNPGQTRTADAPPPRRRWPGDVARALAVLGAEEVTSRAEVRRRYRALVKALHPDMNGGDRSEEDRLRRVLWAWDRIKTARGFDA
jgi:hypothetical protein